MLKAWTEGRFEGFSRSDDTRLLVEDPEAGGNYAWVDRTYTASTSVCVWFSSLVTALAVDASFEIASGAEAGLTCGFLVTPSASAILPLF